MTIQDNKAALKSQAGFTLVELAIVMIIIGLLIGGVLKGQQLITNAQITATVAQIKAIDAATTSFRDQYAGMAGDITNANTRIANCTAAPCFTALTGDGDGKIDNGAAAGITFGAAPPAVSEQTQYWAQLAAAGLLTGLNPNAAATAQAWGQDYPASKINGGGFDIGWNGGGLTLNKLQNTTATAPAEAGHYLALHGTANAIVGGAASDSFLTPNQAARIDTKVDDGQPNTGDIQAAGAAAAGAASCASAGTTIGTYNEALPTAVCSLYIKFQN
jgi:prepilin-type N-terminal cleavage/methylation domain-containing protein